jgi:Ala-tRNA(Pro) deacylase
MPVKKLKEFLDKEHIKYVTISHSPAYTAQEVAQSAHVSAREIAKAVMVRLDGQMAMAVVPANRKVDLGLLQDAAHAEEAELAGEDDFGKLFPECEVGAMPPFGNLYDMPVFVDERLKEDTEIAFNAGNHTELVKLAYLDFERLAHPTIGRFAF